MDGADPDDAITFDWKKRGDIGQLSPLKNFKAVSNRED